MPSSEGIQAPGGSGAGGATAASAARRPAGETRRTLRVHALIDSLACGGAEMLLAELARVAPQAGIELSVGYLQEREGNPAAQRLRAAGVRPLPVGAGGTLRPASLRAVERQLREVEPDLVHTHLAGADLLGGLAARRLGLPWISTVHAASWPERGRQRLRNNLAFALRRWGASRVITVSEPARLAYLGHSGIAPERVLMIPNGIAARPRPGAGAALRAELGLGPERPLALISAPLRHEKGHLRAFAALAAARERVPGLAALLAGTGPDEEEIRAAAERLGGLVVPLGFRDDVMALLDAADFVLHTPLTDALPTSLIEAAAAGVPVVATATGGVPEIVVHAESGLLAPPDATPPQLARLIERLCEDAGLRARLAAGARARFERRWEAGLWARRLRAVYDEVLAGDAAPVPGGASRERPAGAAGRAARERSEAGA